MKITIDTRKMDLAYIVWTMVKNNLNEITSNGSDENDINITLGAFDNCREQGLTICVSNYIEGEIQHRFFSVSENRNTDSIVVYCSKRYEDSRNPSEEFWNNRKFFSYNEHYKASEYIISKIDEIILR